MLPRGILNRLDTLPIATLCEFINPAIFIIFWDYSQVENRCGKKCDFVQLVSCVIGQVPGDINSGVLGVLEGMDHDLKMWANDCYNPFGNSLQMLKEQ
jgi:hypothetical protein